MTAVTARNLVNAQVAIESFDLSPDGTFVVYAARTVVQGAYRSHLWAVPWEGGRPRRLTSGAVRDSVPSIGPDGSVAFVRSPADVPKPAARAPAPAQEAQIWTVPLAGGDSRQVTRLPHGGGSPRWSPDGGSLAFLAEAGPHRFAVGPERPGREITARRITRADFRDDDVGNLSRRTHLWVVGRRRGARPVQLTRGDFDVEDPTWAPDGTWLAFSADMGPDVNLAPHATLHRVSANGGKVSLLASLQGDATDPAVSPDGRWVAFLGTDVVDSPEYEPTRLWLVPADGGAPRSVTRSLDDAIGCWSWADLVQAEDGQGPVWLSSQELAVIVAANGRNVPHRISVSGAMRPLLAPGRVLGAALRVGGGRIAMSGGIDRHAGEVYALEGAGLRVPARARAISTQGSAWQRRFPLPRWDELSVPTAAGLMQVWLASPPGAPSRPMPTIVHLHGGPYGAWGPGGTMDAMHLTARGYRVLMANHRGSAGFGARWAKALAGRWGDVDAQDVLAAVDELVKRELVDPQRLGVMGLSYGGFLAEWLVGVTDRFRAAVAENGVSNHVTAWGNSFFGVEYDRRWKLGDPLTRSGMLRLWRSSPLANVARVHTPLLLLQAEEDRVCPSSDAEQMFIALLALGRDTELILYPEEHHVMKSHGRPDRRIDRMQRSLDWFDRWIGESPA